MVGTALTKDGGAFFKAADARASSITAGGSGDATEITGSYIDRTNYSSCKVIVSYKTVLAAGKSLKLAIGLKDADDSSGTNALAYGSGLASSVVQGPAPSPPAAQYYGTAECDFNIEGARQWLALDVTPDLTASGTDTAIIAVTLVLCGGNTEPVSARLN